MAYRTSNNFEISTTDFITTQVNANFTGVNVYADSGEVTGNNLPCVVVSSGVPIHNRVEVGSFSTRRDVLMLVEVYALNHKFMNDLVDFLVGILKKSWDYNEYCVVNHVSSYTTTGKIVCNSITDAPVNLGINKSELDKIDRYRHLISVVCTTNKTEE